jgi:phage tail sheath protein FI
VAEILSPGVFIEEVPSAAQVIAGVSTSNMGIVGYAQRGPTDKAVLCTSFEQFTRTFGQLVKESFMPLSLASFFANGGRRAFVVRVAPADALAANCQIQSKTTDQSIEVGDGVAALFTKTAATSLLKDNAGASPLVRGSVSVRWRSTGTPVGVDTLLKARDGVTDALFVATQANYEARIAIASLPAFDAGLDSVVRGTVTVTLAVAAAAGGSPITVPIPVGTSSVVTATVGTAPNQTTVTFDHKTGFCSIKTTGNHIPQVVDVGASLGPKAQWTPASATKTATDSAGTWTGDATGTLTYTDGAYSLNTGANIPHNLSPVLATYKINAWDINPISVGKWGNDMKVQVSGHPDYFDASTATYSAFNLNVLLLNTSTGNYEVVESYEELDFSTTTAAQFFPDVVNELSDLITVTEPAGNEAPGELAGVARSKVIGGGNELTSGQTFTAVTLTHAPVAPRTITISYTDSTGTGRTITDNGTGSLIGDIDGTGTNTIVYASGVLNVKLGYTIRGGTLVTVSYRTASEETAHTESFGDTAKSYTEGPKVYFQAGTEGTFDSTNWGINQFTSTTLKASYKGVYALSKVDELMQVCVPDFAGDVTVTGHLLDYADERETLPHGGDRFIILTVPKGSDPQEAVDWFRFDLGRMSKWAALYWPWVKVADPLANNRPLTMPPLGHIAGVYARTDNTRNVGKSPGGTVDGALRYLLGLEYESTQGERDYVYPNKINPLVSSPQTGLAVWGVRTIAPTSEWRYINARRLFMFLEKSVFESTHWIVFENNGPGLWTRIKAQLEGFLKSLFNENYFAGNSPAQAFFVVVDESNNPPESVANGQVIIDVGVAPNKPAEFVRFRFQQKTSQ